MKKILLILLTLFVACSSVYAKGKQELILENELKTETYNDALLEQIKKHNFKPEAGYVPDEKTAIKIAVAVWNPIYGEKVIEGEKPYNAILKNGIWFVSGSLPKGWMGGVAEAEIVEETGQIIRISHGE
ncbi:MAG: YbbC/YhhH family protein [Nitrospinae bacterium]|nr:YbbC/YhhH family protein [Nitrospinota bacterium]